MYHCQKNELVRSLFRPVKITAGFKRLVFLCDAKVSAIKCLCDSFHQICLSVCQSTALLFVSFSVTFGETCRRSLVPCGSCISSESEWVAD